ncbi:MAG: GtrA family protein [Verrucomicrobiaceae bacterium]|nr:MAG: GtrA family protein [Verrucomicrobiaceae bacterium]
MPRGWMAGGTMSKNRSRHSAPEPGENVVIPAARGRINSVDSLIQSLRRLLRFVRDHDRAAVLRLFHSREAPPAVQFVKYGISGAGATAAHVSVYLALITLLWPHLNDPSLNAWERAKSTFPPTAIAFVFSNAFAYWLNMKWVFTPGRHTPLREFLFFTAVNLPGALTGTLAQAMLVFFLHWPKWAALAGFILPNVLINFVCRKFLIFRK